MLITLNGAPRALSTSVPVAVLLKDMGLIDRRVAVEINLEIIPRSEHPNRLLKEGDQVEIVGAIGGG